MSEAEVHADAPPPTASRAAGFSKETEAVLASLMSAGHIAPTAAPMPQPTLSRPWYISVVLGGAGWFAGIFGLVMLGLLFHPESPAAFFTLGCLLLGGAWLTYRIDSEGESEGGFIEQLALSMSIAGQLGVSVGFGIATKSEVGTAFFLAALEGSVALFMPNRLARTLASFCACAAWAVGLRLLIWGEPRWNYEGAAERLAPALFSWFLVWIPVAGLAFSIVRKEAAIIAAGWAEVMRPVLSGLLLALAFCTAASEPFTSFSFINHESTGATNFLALWPFLSLVACLFALYLAFLLRSRALIGTSIAGALLHVGHFYYALGVSLIAKSVIMILVGASLLVLSRALTAKKATP